MNCAGCVSYNYRKFEHACKEKKTYVSCKSWGKKKKRGSSCVGFLIFPFLGVFHQESAHGKIGRHLLNNSSVLTVPMSWRGGATFREGCVLFMHLR